MGGLNSFYLISVVSVSSSVLLTQRNSFLKVTKIQSEFILVITSNKTFPRIILIFAEGEGDGIESRLSAIFLNLFYYDCPKQERKLYVEQLQEQFTLLF